MLSHLLVWPLVLHGVLHSPMRGAIGAVIEERVIGALNDRREPHIYIGVIVLHSEERNVSPMYGCRIVSPREGRKHS